MGVSTVGDDGGSLLLSWRNSWGAGYTYVLGGGEKRAAAAAMPPLPTPMLALLLPLRPLMFVGTQPATPPIAAAVAAATEGALLAAAAAAATMAAVLRAEGLPMTSWWLRPLLLREREREWERERLR